MVEFHGYPGRIGSWAVELWGPSRAYFRRSVHVDCDGGHGVCPDHFPLEGAEYPATRADGY